MEPFVKWGKLDKQNFRQRAMYELPFVAAVA
jgi:hypothetical protein